MFTEKQKVLADAPAVLNQPDRPWEVSVQGDSIIARWKWMDATFFGPGQVTNEAKAYTFTVTLSDKGKWKENDKTQIKKTKARMGGGKLSFGASSGSFSGKSTQKSFQFGAGKNNQTGEAGIVSFSFDTSKVKKPIREYLESCGWKKAGLFG